jgi:elongation factor Ts
MVFDGEAATEPRRARPDRQQGRSTMATITAAMVKELRETTGVGMMDCKQALTENDGNMEAAIDWLRKKGLSKAAKKSGRVAAEGLIGVVTAGTRGVVVEVNSETDFVARNEQFQGLVKMIAQVALKVGADVEKIKAAPVGDVTVERAIQDAIATIGENMTLRRAASLEVSQGVVASYVHNAVIEGAGKMGVIVALESSGKTDELAVLGKQLAMHVAAANPQALDPAGLDPAAITREKDVLADKYRQAGKPENVIEKIVDSGLKTFYKEVCLLEQASVHGEHNGKSVAQVLKEAEGKVGAPVKVTGFVRYALGEGIEKQESDFAAEVAAASGQKKPEEPSK